MNIERQLEIRKSKSVSLHLCCSDASWLYRIYQDTIVDKDEMLLIITDALDESKNYLSTKLESAVDYTHITPTMITKVSKYALN